MSIKNLEHGKATEFTKENAAEMGSRGGKSPKRLKTLSVKRIMTKYLQAGPEMNDRLTEQLRQLGVDPDDDDIQTNASLLIASVLQKAYTGDMAAIQLAFEMAGQAVTAKDQTDRDKIALEKQKLKLLEHGGTSADAPVINIAMGKGPDKE